MMNDTIRDAFETSRTMLNEATSMKSDCAIVAGKANDLRLVLTRREEWQGLNTATDLREELSGLTKRQD